VREFRFAAAVVCCEDALVLVGGGLPSTDGVIATGPYAAGYGRLTPLW
jgi:hypothetical protein